ncbi:DUF4468 domain-containing protein [Hymenobacter nivis]|uniref:DUF4468 domain-containing protein n=1 Tax=Hymenobacter nivis TaxID=1850093 RepID=A0A2Z3GQS9_9BACT|nr:DUF4468 domain-containing protein [Hymenobacter nivis]AWM33385.1 hypothetical protein DDQ68_11690 [Hymenobacter nivis]
MKSLLLLLSLALAAPAVRAQSAPALPVDPTTHLVAYSAVVDIPGATESELFRRARAWALRRYKGDAAVLQVQDAATGKIIVKGRTQALVNGRSCGPVGHVLSIRVLKAGQYQYNVTHFVNTNTTPTGDYGMGPFEREKPHLTSAYTDEVTDALMQKTWNLLRVNTDDEIKTMLGYLQAAMTDATQDAKL